MRTIERSSAFKRDYKREATSPRPAKLDEVMESILIALATDQPLDVRYRDHDLSGRKSDADTLRLARFGSHSELFG